MGEASYDVNRGRVIAAAAELFARNSYHGTGITELGKAVGLGRGALYHYIGSKEAILYAISKDQVDKMNDQAEDLLSKELPAEDRVREMARGLLRNIADHRAEWTVFFRDYDALTGERRAEVIAARERYESHWQRALEIGVRGGVWRPTPPILVKGVLGMLNYTYLWLTADGEMTPEEVADVFLGSVIDGIRN